MEPIFSRGAMLRLLLTVGLLLAVSAPFARDLPEIRAAGELRHLGVRYANFVTGDGQGFDVELVQGFARSLGVKYRFVESDWSSVIGDLLGRRVTLGEDGHARDGAATQRRGDLIATGLTVLDWRSERLAFSESTFPTGVWLVVRADSPLQPIVPAGSRAQDIALTRVLLDGQSVLAVENSCLDPRLYRLADSGARVHLVDNQLNLNELVPRLLSRKADATLLDVPDALIALDKWPGEIKILGPISGEQVMAAAFAPDAPQLRAAFDRYLAQIRRDGRYRRLVEKYYPAAPLYFPEFFRRE